LVAGLEEPTEGAIFIGGKGMKNIPPGERDIAMVFQNHALYPHMSAYENMGFGLKVRKCSRKEIETRVLDAAELLGLMDCLDRKPRELSGGQRQRVALGRAIVRRPEVFLFDEPLSNLDAQMRVQMRTEIAKLHKRLGATMIYVTHDQTEAMTIGERIAVLNRGIVQQVGEPMDVYEGPANLFVAGFIGSPQMNFFDAHVVNKDGNLFIEEQNDATDGIIGERLLAKVHDKSAASLKEYEGKKIIIGIRPEKLRRKQNGIATNGAGIEAVVELVEPTGADSFSYVSRGKQSLVFRMGRGETAKASERLALGFELAEARFFDPVTGKGIG
jgi:multiple sugar transport system ATP-binding protein